MPAAICVIYSNLNFILAKNRRELLILQDDDHWFSSSTWQHYIPWFEAVLVTPGSYQLVGGNAKKRDPDASKNSSLKSSLNVELVGLGPDPMIFLQNAWSTVLHQKRSLYTRMMLPNVMFWRNRLYRSKNVFSSNALIIDVLNIVENI